MRHNVKQRGERTELDIAFGRQQDVCRLDITVNFTFRVQVIETM